MSDSGEQDSAQKTEEPTQKKIQDSRKKGQVAKSQEVNHFIMLLAGTIVIGAFSGSILTNMSLFLRNFIANAHALPPLPGGMSPIMEEMFFQVFAFLALPLLFLWVAAFFAGFLQVGPLLAPEAIKPDFSKVSPIKGAKRLFSVKSLMEFAKSLFKFFLIAVVALILLYPYYDSVGGLIGTPVETMMEELLYLFIRLMIGVLIAMLVIAVVDLLFQQQQHHEQMKMTKQEVKDEMRQTEGDPHVKAKLRQLRQERAQQRMMQNVPESDVVITNPTHFAVALKYDPDNMDAPLVMAKGVDEVAERIREVAKENDIILYENPPLARSLYDSVEVNEFIPAEFYKAVAEIISYVFKKKGKL